MDAERARHAFADLGDQRRLLLDGLVQPVDVDQQHGAGTGRIPDLERQFERRERRTVHQLQGRRHDAVRHQRRDGRARRLDRVEHRQEGRRLRRHGQQAHPGLRHHAERAFGADYEAAQIVAGSHPGPDRRACRADRRG